jgi:hypothetical protein
MKKEDKGLMKMVGVFMRTMKAVAWSFVGIRSRKGYENDISRISPWGLVLAGWLGGLMFVGVLVGIVSWVVAK